MNRMRKRTSSSGRRQFSVENANTVIHFRPTSSPPSTVSKSASSPAACPSVRLRPRRCAQRPLPSITIATWRGSRGRSIPCVTARTLLEPRPNVRLRMPATLPRRAVDCGREPERGSRSHAQASRPTLRRVRRARRRRPCLERRSRWVQRRSRRVHARPRRCRVWRRRHGERACRRGRWPNAPFALVPTGAGNDFARHLGIDPRRPLEAIDLLRSGRLGLADLGRAGPATEPSESSRRSPTPASTRRRTGGPTT